MLRGGANVPTVEGIKKGDALARNILIQLASSNRTASMPLSLRWETTVAHRLSPTARNAWAIS
jgi:hypothetical protein